MKRLLATAALLPLAAWAADEAPAPEGGAEGEARTCPLATGTLNGNLLRLPVVQKSYGIVSHNGDNHRNADDFNGSDLPVNLEGSQDGQYRFYYRTEVTVEYLRR